MWRKYKVQTFFGDLHIITPQRREDDDWGCLLSLKDTEWEEYIPVISGRDFSYALHGHTQPLVKALSTPPNGICIKIKDAICRNAKICPMYGSKCRPGFKDIPECYEHTDDEVLWQVIMYWSRGFYVIRVEGEEFN